MKRRLFLQKLGLGAAALVAAPTFLFLPKTVEAAPIQDVVTTLGPLQAITPPGPQVIRVFPDASVAETISPKWSFSPAAYPTKDDPLGQYGIVGFKFQFQGQTYGDWIKYTDTFSEEEALRELQPIAIEQIQRKMGMLSLKEWVIIENIPDGPKIFKIIPPYPDLSEGMEDIWKHSWHIKTPSDLTYDDPLGMIGIIGLKIHQKGQAYGDYVRLSSDHWTPKNIAFAKYKLSEKALMDSLSLLREAESPEPLTISFMDGEPRYLVETRWYDNQHQHTSSNHTHSIGTLATNHQHTY